MKKFLNLVLSFAIIASFTGCGNNTTENNGNTDSSSDSSVAVNNSEVVNNSESEKDSAAEEETTEVKRQDYVNMEGVKVAIPKDFTYEPDASYYTTYSGSASTNDKMYYAYDHDIYYGFMDTDMKDYTCKDVPKILEVAEISMVNDFFDYLREKNVETEEDVEVNGFPFLKQKGTFQVKLDGEDTYRDVYFIGYYGCMNLEYTGGSSVPMMWLIYSEVTDEATKTDMENVIDNCTAQATFIEE